jgi:chromosome segregation ATPase
MRFSRSKSPAPSPEPEPGWNVATEARSALVATEKTTDLVALASAEREAEELLARRRHELEKAQAAAWDRRTEEIRAGLETERRRREQLEAELQHSESRRVELERQVVEADWYRRDSQRTHSQLGPELAETRSQLARAQSELFRAQDDLAKALTELDETRTRLEGELARAVEERDRAKTKLRPRSKRKVAKAMAKINELETRLRAERTRRADLDVAIQLLGEQYESAVQRAEEAERTALERPQEDSVVPHHVRRALVALEIALHELQVVQQVSDAGPSASDETARDDVVEDASFVDLTDRPGA